MATDYQTVNLTAKTFPFQQVSSFNASRYSTVPWGQAIVNHSFQTTTTGAGNDGLISIDVELPSDYVAMLRGFHLQVVDTATINWSEATLGFAYQEPGGPYKNSVTEYPEDEYSWYQLYSDQMLSKDRFASSRYIRSFFFGTNINHNRFNDGWDPTQLPLWIPPTVDSNFAERSMILFIENASASQPAQEMTFRASFDLYTFDQAYSAAVMSSPRVFS